MDNRAEKMKGNQYSVKEYKFQINGQTFNGLRAATDHLGLHNSAFHFHLKKNSDRFILKDKTEVLILSRPKQVLAHKKSDKVAPQVKNDFVPVTEPVKVNTAHNKYYRFRVDNLTFTSIRSLTDYLRVDNSVIHYHLNKKTAQFKIIGREVTILARPNAKPDDYVRTYNRTPAEVQKPIKKLYGNLLLTYSGQTKRLIHTKIMTPEEIEAYNQILEIQEQNQSLQPV